MLNPVKNVNESLGQKKEIFIRTAKKASDQNIKGILNFLVKVMQVEKGLPKPLLGHS